MFIGLFAPNVEKLQAKGDLKGLIKALTYPKDSRIRSQAARALGELHDPQSLEALVQALNDPIPEVRMDLLWEIGKRGNPQTLKPFLAAVAKDWYRQETQTYASKAIGNFGPAAAEFLIAVLTGPYQGKEGCAAAHLLGKIGAEHAWEILVQTLQDEKSNAVDEAAQALIQIDAQRAIQPMLIAMIRQNRSWLNTYLLKIGEPVTPAIVQLLSDPNPEIRAVAAQLLKERNWIPDESTAGATYWIYQQDFKKCVERGAFAIEPLLQALKDRRYLRKNAAEALDELGWKPGSDEYGVYYWIARHNWEACFALGGIALNPLIVLLGKQEERTIRQNAAKTLIRLYQSDQLTAEQKQIILNTRPIITSHTDFPYCSYHDDDGGIGIAFPL